MICNTPLIECNTKITMPDLINTIVTPKDIVIWDNFPDGYVNGQNDTLGNNKLTEISSYKVNHLIISIKADYMEYYRNSISNLPELHSFPITYVKGEIKKILETYGKTIKKFSLVFNKFIEKNIDVIGQILYSKEPLPSTVYIYYNQLTNTSNKENNTSYYGIQLAQEFDSSSQYYKKQFEILSKRNNYAKIYFLYTLKLCYELGLDRTRRFIMQLQQNVFGIASPPNPLEDLSIWIEFTSGKYYSMSNLARNSIIYPSDFLPDIIEYLSNNFNDSH